MKGLRWGFPLALALLLAACRQGAAPEGTEITVRVFQGRLPGSAPVAYQIGDGAWRPATPREAGVYAFRLPSEEKRYGVAAVCPSFILYTTGWVRLYQLTADDTTAPSIQCQEGMTPTTPLRDLTIRVEKSAGDPGTYNMARFTTRFTAYYGLPIGQGLWLRFAAKPAQELLIAAYDSHRPGEPPQRIRFDRHVDALVPPSGTVVYTLDTGDAPATGTVALQNTGRQASYRVDFLSREGLFTGSGFLGGQEAASGPFARVPGAAPGDLYEVLADTEDGASRGQIAVKFLAYNESTATVTFGGWFDPGVEVGARPRFTGLSYGDAGTLGFLLQVHSYGSRYYPSYTLVAFVSRAWLGRAETYRVPDLASLSGFGGTTPVSGDRVRWSAQALVANRSLEELLALDPTARLSYVAAFPIPREAGFSLRLAGKDGRFVVP